MSTTDTKEIITIQVGPEAGWMATGFWNAQGDPGKDVNQHPGFLFRECPSSSGQRGVTHAPRTLILDQARNLGSLDDLVRASPQEEADAWERGQRAKEEQWTAPAWGQEGRKQVIHRHPPPSSSNSTSLRERIRKGQEGAGLGDLWQGGKGGGLAHWPDLLMTPISSGSLSTIPPSAPMNHASEGETWMREDQQVEAILEGKLRLLMEEADTPQGFQILSSTGSGWGGVTSVLLDHLTEEYPRLGRLLLPLLPGPHTSLVDPVLAPCYSLTFLAHALSTETLIVPMEFGGSSSATTTSPDTPIRLYEQGSTLGMALDLLSRIYR